MPIGHACVVSAQRELNPLLRTGKPACSLEHLGRETTRVEGGTRTRACTGLQPVALPSWRRRQESGPPRVVAHHRSPRTGPLGGDGESRTLGARALAGVAGRCAEPTGTSSPDNVLRRAEESNPCPEGHPGFRDQLPTARGTLHERPRNRTSLAGFGDQPDPRSPPIV